MAGEFPPKQADCAPRSLGEGAVSYRGLCFTLLPDREIGSIFNISWLFRISVFLIFWHHLNGLAYLKRFSYELIPFK